MKAFYKENLYIKDGAENILYTIQPQTNYTATNRIYSHKLLYIVYKGRGGLLKITVKIHSKNHCKFTEISL